MKDAHFLNKIFLMSALTIILLWVNFLCLRSLAYASDIVVKKVMVIIYNPIIEIRGNKRLIEVFNWNNPENLEKSYIEDIKNVSGGFANYRVVERIEVDGYPMKEDGYIYTDEEYVTCIENKTGSCHVPGNDIKINYQKILTDYNVCQKLNTGTIDELWLWGGPWFGYYEAVAAGTGAYDLNGPVITGTICQRILPIMGYGYERGVSEMVEDIGHRTEGTMRYVYNGWQRNTKTPWNMFTIRDIDMPGKAQCGDVHYAPNSTSDYDWANTRTVLSACDDWYTYPILSGNYLPVNCYTWGCNGYEYKKWWLNHLPRGSGFNNGKLINWWQYIMTPDVANGFPTPTPFLGDLNGDGVVNFWDEAVLLTRYLTNDKGADLNGDGKVNGVDFGRIKKMIL